MEKIKLLGERKVEVNSSQNLKNNVEIFSAMVNGMDTTKYGKKVDDIDKFMRQQFKLASEGNPKAIAEINAIRTIMIEMPLTQRIQTMGLFGDYFEVGFDEQIKFEIEFFEGEGAREQAINSPAPLGKLIKKTETMTDFTTISGGMARDYRKLAAGNYYHEAEEQSEVINRMYNKMTNIIINKLRDGISGFTGYRNFSEADGIGRAALIEAATKARRYGHVSLIGDYRMVSQINDMAGFTTDITATTLAGIRYSQAVMDMVMRTGLVADFLGSSVLELKNEYNENTQNEDNDFYDTYLPEDLLFVIPNGKKSPLKVGTRGGITSMVGADINTGEEIQRFDIEFGTFLVEEQIPRIGLIIDNPDA